MQSLLRSTLILLLAHGSLLAASSFEKDRAAILGMAGEFRVTFNFEETVPLVPGYELRKPYESAAKELVTVADDQGDQITLQHLLVVTDMDGPMVIKHWAQIWTYEDKHVLNYEGNMTWRPKTRTDKKVKGTWTQYVTQVDDSPRYKAAGEWTHDGNYSAWTSQPSTRPLPRREYTKRDDYDLVKCVNRHVITPDGWTHLQQNRKYVRRNGQNHSLCLERGINTYQRVTKATKIDKEDFAAARKYWRETHPFWAKVRAVWNQVVTNISSPIHYESSIPVSAKEGEAAKKKSQGDGGKSENEKKDKKPKSKTLMMRMSQLAEDYKSDDSIAKPEIKKLLKEHLR
jgi:hypothetical protein